MPLLIAFLLPFGINYSFLIIIWAISFFVLDDVKTKLNKVFINKWFLIFITFFLIHVLGYFFSSNKLEALTAIEIKLSFLAFPILFYASVFNEVQVKKILISFVSGCFIASLLNVFRAIYLYLFNDINAFFYTEFSYFMHPSYFAMYLIFAQLIILFFYNKWLSHLSHLYFKLGFISSLFLITIFLCSSKMGLITAFLLLPTSFFVILYHKGYKKIIMGLVVVFFVAFLSAYKIFPTPFERMKYALKVSTNTENIDKTDGESTAVRILIWKESIQIIKNNFLFGTTPGDANDFLVESYKHDGLTGALRKNLNAHNQFLQTFIGTGIFGLVLLCIFTFGAVIYGFITKNYILLLFSVLVIFNFLVESMLQAQAGFIFFVFFFCLLTRYHIHKFNIK
jgi:O-antigen ligase